MQSKRLRKRKGRFTLSEINELVMCMFIVKRDIEKAVCEKINSEQGVVLNVSRGKGVSRYSVFEAFGVGSSDISLIVSQARKEDAEDLIKAVSVEFKFNVPGNGKGFAINVEGYMGAKAPFVEE